MNTREEIRSLEEQLRLAELGPDAAFFERVLADDAVLDGQLAKSKVVEAHRSKGTAKFSKVEMSDFEIFDHGQAAVVTCTGRYEGPRGVHTLKFMRVWLKKSQGWQIIAGS
ncbi:MAG TPA: nuclear transport factor 2 family protein, partial [Polyangiaceae bacterium]|nr:nuclear transport factor 2 family protein [Polyangiaceae bacterium]